MDYMPHYVPPCLSERSNSLESRWLDCNDFGECFREGSDVLTYPRVIPVYNGKVLNIDYDFVHASLSGISIKHYYGKCLKEDDEEDDEEMEQLEVGGEYSPYELEALKSSPSKETLFKPLASLSSESSSGTFEYRDSFYLEGQPLCTLPKINHRNSFWNIHRPELCKLTWGQKYVGASTVLEHLHEHLVNHGYLCQGFHTQDERDYLLKKELDEYVRLKLLACPRELPPDEPAFNLKEPPQAKKRHPNPKCKIPPIPIEAVQMRDRYLALSDDEDVVEKGIRRSKEEFCLTIGKHVHQPPIFVSASAPLKAKEEEEEAEEEEEMSLKYYYGQEEAAESFYYDWFLYTGEEDYEHAVPSGSMTMSSSDYDVDPCPPHILDEFCRAAGKVDFSDIRCKPDF